MWVCVVCVCGTVPNPPLHPLVSATCLLRSKTQADVSHTSHARRGRGASKREAVTSAECRRRDVRATRATRGGAGRGSVCDVSHEPSRATCGQNGARIHQKRHERHASEMGVAHVPTRGNVGKQGQSGASDAGQSHAAHERNEGGVRFGTDVWLPPDLYQAFKM